MRPLAGFLLLLACFALTTPALGGLRAGAAEGVLDAPIGLPLAGYTGRASLFGFQRADNRVAPFVNLFAPSTAVQTPPLVKAVALDAGGGDVVVLVKVDLIFSDAYLLRAVEDLAAAASGESLRGRVLLTASHSHNAPGRFTQNTALMAGADTYHEVTFRRYAESIAEVVRAALAARADARMGIGIDAEFDPLGRDAVFRDRRSENDPLAPDGSFLFEPDGVTVDLDAPGAQGPSKDAALSLVRIDRVDGAPIAVVVHFGIHGTALGDAVAPLDAEHAEERHLWVSGEAASAVEWKLEESFARPVVVMHLQGAAGDVSPSGDDLGHHGFARLELIGERARDAAAVLWRATPTASEVALRVATRTAYQDLVSVHVDRGGAVDWRYPEPPVASFDGNVSTFEDFGYPLGAALCGGQSFSVSGGVEELLPEQRAQVEHAAASPNFGRGLVYGSCLAADDSTFGLFSSILDPSFDPAVDLPIPESLSTLVSAVALEGVPLVRTSGSDALGNEVQRTNRSRSVGFPRSEPKASGEGGAEGALQGARSEPQASGAFTRTDAARVLLAAAPGEPTSDWSDRLRGRAQSELGYDEALVLGYAQDHEGYLLLPEDWLSGGSTEVQVNVWGPLQGEYLLERILDAAVLVATPASIDPDPGPLDPAPAVWPLVPFAAKATPLAGTALALPAAAVERLHTASFEWVGGDPAVDRPRVTLQRRQRDGVFRDVLLPSGRRFDDRTHRIVWSYRPEPLNARPPQIERHRYRAYFQVVRDLPSLADAAGFARGSYRFRVTGRAFDGSAEHGYELFSAPFRVTATDDHAIEQWASDGASICGRVVLPAATGFRLESTTARADQPVPAQDVLVHVGAHTLAWTNADGRFVLPALAPGSELAIDDWYGNHARAVVPDSLPAGCPSVE